MNPLTNMRNIKKLSEQELQRLPKSSWHDEYKTSAWIFVGGLPYDLSEGDVMTIFSQYGEITNLNLVRDKDTGKQKGFCFICYEDQRSTVLAVDNFNGTRVLGRILRVDHVKDYKPPKSSEPTNKIKTEKLDDDIRIKNEFNADIKQEILTPEIKREICTPEIKREICTPEIKREVCTPEIIRSPKRKNSKKKKKSKDLNKMKHYKDKSIEKDNQNYNKSGQDKSYEKKNNYKRPRYSRSKQRDINEDSKTILYKKNISDKSKDRERNRSRERDKSRERDRSREKNRSKERHRSRENNRSRERDRSREKDKKQFNDNKKEYKNKDHDDKYKNKYLKDNESYKKYKK